MDEKISIIVPFYNTGEFIKTSVNSLKNQTSQNFEVIFINDGSTDNTKNMLEKMLVGSNLNFKVIDKKNEGVSVARNLGVKEAKGKYIYYYDSDDLVSEILIEKLIKEIEKKPEVVIFGYDVVDANLNLIKRWNLDMYKSSEDGKKILQDFLEGKISVNTESILFSKAFLMENDLKYNKELRFGEDQEFNMIALYKAKKVNVLNSQLSFYIKHKESTTAGEFNRIRYGLIKKFEKLNELVQEEKLIEAIKVSKSAEILYLSSIICRTLNLEEAISELTFLKKHFFDFISLRKLSYKYKIAYILVLLFPRLYYYLMGIIKSSEPYKAKNLS